MTDSPWSCGCTVNRAGAHRYTCPDYRSVGRWDGAGKKTRTWIARDKETT